MKKETTPSAIDAALLRAGFKRAAYVWRRWRGELVDVIEMQRSFHADVTVNIGIVISALVQRVWPGHEVQFREAEGAVRTRLGDLVLGRDQWWSMSDVTTPGQIRGLIESHALTFLAKFATRSDVEEWLAERKNRRHIGVQGELYLALLQFDRGAIADARRRVETFRDTTISSLWRSFADELLTGLSHR